MVFLANNEGGCLDLVGLLVAVHTATVVASVVATVVTAVVAGGVSVSTVTYGRMIEKKDDQNQTNNSCNQNENLPSTSSGLLNSFFSLADPQNRGEI